MVRQLCRIFSTPKRFLERAVGPDKLLLNFFVARPVGAILYVEVQEDMYLGMVLWCPWYMWMSTALDSERDIWVTHVRVRGERSWGRNECGPWTDVSPSIARDCGDRLEGESLGITTRRSLPKDIITTRRPLPKGTRNTRNTRNQIVWWCDSLMSNNSGKLYVSKK